ncbi:MAG: universal stress protein [Rhodobacteraceae bacterium]|nr:universal stress protein [Paracoccaceae bacterium]
MTKTIVVGYDGSESADRAIDFATERAKSQGVSITVAHVLEWSPYSFLTPQEIEERHARWTEELKRAEEMVVAPVLKKLSAAGVEARSEIKYGHIADTICDVAKSANAAQIVIGRTGHSSLTSRLFGSVAGTLAQASPVPVTIVP